MYAVQGPKSKDMINSLVKENIDELKFFTISDNEIDGVPVKINRAGFTGEKPGYEIYIAADKADFIEKNLFKKTMKEKIEIVIYGFCTKMAEGVTGERIIVDSGMMRNIMSF